MAELPRGPRVHERWAHLRFSVVGQLLAAPPTKGELKAAITELAQRAWQHPTTGEPVRFGFSTIERWYYRALRERTDPVGVLRRKVLVNAGQQHAVSDAVRQAVLAQYAAHTRRQVFHLRACRLASAHCSSPSAKTKKGLRRSPPTSISRAHKFVETAGLPSKGWRLFSPPPHRAQRSCLVCPTDGLSQCRGQGGASGGQSGYLDLPI